MLISQGMSQDFQPGDYLVFQLESGFGLLRVLAIEETAKDIVWHVAGYSDLFPDVDTADAAIANGRNLPRSASHIALTNRAFESTQVAKIGHTPIQDDELAAYEEWKAAGGVVSDRSVRLMLGLR
jgi:hypothetical protein